MCVFVWTVFFTDVCVCVGGVGLAQWVACLTGYLELPVSREFEPHQRLLLFPSAKNFTLIAQYWLVPGMYLSAIYINKSGLFHNQTKINLYKLNHKLMHVLF
mgnify:CR=1 FL=1